MTTQGGGHGYGSAFEIAKGSTVITSLASFNAIQSIPRSGVTFDSSGDLFGRQYGGNGYGAVFEIAGGSSTITTIAAFNNVNGEYPI